ncbi:hypothetical protein HG530_004000 [Fusarium avenaceum]|nr:hypothetical protein HG530_004000 [Fusarium avenaceum]
MIPSSPDVHKALEIVDRVCLAHPASTLLREYILEAVQPQAAAHYVQRRLSAEGHANALVADWIYVIDSLISGAQPRAPSHDEIKSITKRDGTVCCVTGKQGSLRDPVIVTPILPVPSGWLNAEGGIIKLQRLPSSMIEFKVENVIIDDEQPVNVNGVFALLGDHSRQGIEKVDARLIGSHARFCKSIQLVKLARNIAPSLFSSTTAITSSARQQLPVLMVLWRLFPSTIRITVYELLLKIGNYFYKKDGNAMVQRLPFGLYLKYNSDSATLRNEYNALKTLEQKTSIPAPRALDIVSQSTGENDFSYLLITRVPGTTLAKCLDALSDQDYATVSTQLKECISQMREISKPVNYSMAICNTLGEACRDPRIRDWAPVGPCPDEASFSQYLRFPDEPSRRGHNIVFTHGDLNPRNIMVERTRDSIGVGSWRSSGIIDWETAGYYPDY